MFFTVLCQFMSQQTHHTQLKECLATLLYIDLHQFVTDGRRS